MWSYFISNSLCFIFIRTDLKSWLACNWLFKWSFHLKAAPPLPRSANSTGRFRELNMLSRSTSWQKKPLAKGLLLPHAETFDNKWQCFPCERLSCTGEQELVLCADVCKRRVWVNASTQMIFCPLALNVCPIHLGRRSPTEFHRDKETNFTWVKGKAQEKRPFHLHSDHSSPFHIFTTISLIPPFTQESAIDKNQSSIKHVRTSTYDERWIDTQTLSK